MYLLPAAICSIPLVTGLITSPSSSDEETNRLVDEQSPYLLQHAHNPVDWFPWGDEAFDRATKEGKLIFLSIGYSTCHWCHVMEKESFEDKEVAALLQQDYIAVKVDREERPDIDQFYMQVAMALNGSGGWPLTIVMTADKTPIFAGTYFAKERQYNRPGLMELLPQIADVWKQNPDGLRQNGKAVVGQLQQRAAEKSPSQTIAVEQLTEAAKILRGRFDSKWGGFGEAPKFPTPHNLSFLLHRYYRTGQADLLEMVEKTLQSMRSGGIYDQVGFGFHRYSTDAEWLVPHFEKMLYDQAGLAQVYLEAFQLTGNVDYETTAREIFSYAMTHLHDPEGGFYSAEDADSNGVEGEFYVWQKEELLEILGPDRGSRFAQIFQVLSAGNFSAHIPGAPAGTNIPHQIKPISDWADLFGLSLDELNSQLEEDRAKLFTYRQQRVHPFRDDKVITAWNGQMISALALGARAVADPQLLEDAEQAVDFILSKMQTKEGQLLRRWRNGHAAIPAFASDYAFVSRGLLDLYHSSLKPFYLQQAIDLAEQLATRFTDQHGQLFETTADSELPLRISELYDGALPSAGSITLEVFARLYLLTGNKIWEQRADALLQASAGQISQYPAGYTQFLLGASLLLEPTRELVVVGPRGHSDTDALLKDVQQQYMPDTLLLLRPTGNSEEIDQMVPFLSGMVAVNDQATAYLCQNFACLRPQTNPKELGKLLKVKLKE